MYAIRSYYGRIDASAHQHARESDLARRNSQDPGTDLSKYREAKRRADAEEDEPDAELLSYNFV